MDRIWTPDEDALLRRYAAAELTARAVARTLRRSRASIVERAEILGLAFAKEIEAQQGMRAVA